MSTLHVTEPFLPPLDEYVRYLEGIWERNWLTNKGPLSRELESRIAEFLGLSSPVICVANGALGLQIALHALGVSGEVITTPFSYVATVSCPLWEGCSLRFADIEEDFLTIDPAAVEASITDRTEAILATHVFGNPCEVEALEAIAARHGLALIYDAAHALGVDYRGRSILEWGDVSMVSLHATKLFHSVEGGILTARNAEVFEKMEWMRRFGHDGPEAFHGVGTNAKMSELHAAMGLAVLPYLEEIIRKRHALIRRYEERLASVERVVPALTIRENTKWNGAYFPVRFQSEETLMAAMKAMDAREIIPRRYFYPNLCELSFTGADGDVPVCARLSRRILCLPLAASMSETDVDRVTDALAGS